ncbi:HD domain-containing protein [Novosphingobium sp. KACC 22771]|uniref:HD domain-containing protein n=1 Tax=Novosphingobium sp. KACC 22771 TaxID=3025670 RepID=UPI0023659148|nr:HD domain-containing protein [Novosphingobium sp. KACC 22771]WDF74392.1 HD domain-containing protein [Novosphingobium sp. KACC 22771]
MPIVLDACAFAVRMHGNQQRKYTGDPYVLHCLEVARIVAEVGGSPTMIAAALLHDVVEDTEANIEDVQARFGEEIAQGVAWLSDVSRPEDGNRVIRKAMDREHLAQAPADMKTVKLADVISNTRSIVDHGDGLARVYLREIAALLEVLSEGHPELLQRAKAEVARGESKWLA